jgi:putative hydrolase of the HAD superfamily
MFIQYFGHQLSPRLSVDDFIQMSDRFIRPVEGMTSLLARLQAKGIELAICSNNSEFWYRRQMEKVGLNRFFSPSKVILSCRVGVSKSSPGFELFHAVTDALSVASADCIFVDDRDSNVSRARECGMVGICFTGAENLETSLKQNGALD